MECFDFRAHPLRGCSDTYSGSYQGLPITGVNPKPLCRSRQISVGTRSRTSLDCPAQSLPYRPFAFPEAVSRRYRRHAQPRPRLIPNAAFMQDEAAASTSTSSPSHLPPHLRSKRVASYDPSRFPFAALVSDIIRGESESAHGAGWTHLARIHETEACARW